jgi:uncharacterized protein (DUF488 family)
MVPGISPSAVRLQVRARLYAHVPVFTIGHGRRSAAELVALLQAASVLTLVDVRRFPTSRWNPQFNRRALAETLQASGIDYVQELELGGRRRDEPGAELFACLSDAAFRAYAARMARDTWQEALAAALAHPTPAFMCAETLPARCHRRLIADLLHARGHDVVHLVRPRESHPHVLSPEAHVSDGKLLVCGSQVA